MHALQRLRAGLRSQRQRKPGRSGKIGLALGRDLVQGAAAKSALQCGVDRFDADRNSGLWFGQPRGFDLPDGLSKRFARPGRHGRRLLAAALPLRDLHCLST